MSDRLAARVYQLYFLAFLRVFYRFLIALALRREYESIGHRLAA